MSVTTTTTHRVKKKEKHSEETAFKEASKQQTKVDQQQQLKTKRKEKWKSNILYIKPLNIIFIIKFKSCFITNYPLIQCDRFIINYKPNFIITIWNKNRQFHSTTILSIFNWYNFCRMFYFELSIVHIDFEYLESLADHQKNWFLTEHTWWTTSLSSICDFKETDCWTDAWRLQHAHAQQQS